MTQPIRERVFAVTDFKEPEKMTLREAIEWYKAVVVAAKGGSSLELKYVNQRWAVLVDAIAERESVPSGSLSYFLGELAQAEMALPEIVQAELEGRL